MTKMLSKIIGSFFLVMFCVEVACSASAQELFLANQELVLSQKATLVENRLFAVGRVKSNSRLGDSIGFDKAALRAYQNVDWFLFKSAPWPSLVKEDECAILWEMYRLAAPFKAKVEGATRLLESREANDKFTVVLAIPIEEVKKLQRVSEEELLILLQHYRSYTDVILKEGEKAILQLKE